MQVKKEDLLKIFGTEGVSFDDALLKSFGKTDMCISGVCPECVVYAENSSQIENFIQLANRTGTPVIPVSSCGGGHKRGGTLPLCAGTIILSLERMKKIIELNEPFRMLTIEAGVTYGEVNDYLKNYGLMVDMPLAPKAERSVAASLLEGEPRLNPNINWASYSPLSCTEVIWGDGTRMFTGEAGTSAPDYDTMRQKSHIAMTMNCGPANFDYNRVLYGAQGTTGVVSWVALRCGILPSVHNMYFLHSDTPSELVGMLYDLEHVRFGECLLLVNAAAFAALATDSEEDCCKLQKKLPPWVCAVSFANRPPFSEKRAFAHEAGARRFAEARGLTLESSLAGISGEQFKEKIFNPCAPGKYWKDLRRGASMDVTFISTMDRFSAFDEELRSVARLSEISMDNISVSLQPLHQGVNCQCDFSIAYDPENTEEKAEAARLWEHLVKRFSEMHAFFAHPVGLECQIQFEKDPDTTVMQRKMKDIFDPNGIMNPGKLVDYRKEGKA